MGTVNKVFARDANSTPFPYTSHSTGLLDASAVIKAAEGVLVDVLVYTDGTNNATVIVYDDVDSANGTVLAKVVVKGSDLMGGEVSIMVDAHAGMYMAISGTGATALIRYV